MNEPRVLLVGATSAIASAVARRLARRGARLFLLARNETRLAALAAELGEAVVGTAAGDFRELGQNGARVHAARRALGGLDLVFIAHGELGQQLETERNIGAAHALIEANLSSVVSFLVPLANLLEAQGSGTIAVITSVAGERGRPRNYTYGATKAALNVYLQGLRSRLYPAGVQVVTLKLGPVDTPMTADHPKTNWFVTADQAAHGIVEALDRGKSEAFIPGYWGPVMSVVRRLPEAVFQRIPFLVGR